MHVPQILSVGGYCIYAILEKLVEQHKVDPTGWHIDCSTQCIKYHIPSVLYRCEGQGQQVSSSLGM